MGSGQLGSRPFRFGVVAPVRAGMPAWRDQVRQVADLGYATLLMPDVSQWQPAPAPTLATAAALAPALRVGTWVYAAPLRPAWQVAWESHSMTVLTEGRFELGIGTGRPDMAEELRGLGLPVVPPSQRLAQVREAVVALRALDGARSAGSAAGGGSAAGAGRRTPVAMAVRGPRARALAAELADTVTFASSADDVRADVVQLALELRAVRPDIELALHVAVLGDVVAPFMSRPDVDTDALHAAGAMQALPADPGAAIEELLRRREEAGFSYVVVGAGVAAAFAPVVAELAGR